MVSSCQRHVRPIFEMKWRPRAFSRVYTGDSEILSSCDMYSVGGSYVLISHVVHVDFAQFSWKQTCFAPKWPQLQSLFPCLLIPVGWSKAYFLKFHPAILLPPSRGQSELWTSLHGLHTCPAWDCNDLLSDFSPGQCI